MNLLTSPRWINKTQKIDRDWFMVIVLVYFDGGSKLSLSSGLPACLLALVAS